MTQGDYSYSLKVGVFGDKNSGKKKLIGALAGDLYSDPISSDVRTAFTSDGTDGTARLMIYAPTKIDSFTRGLHAALICVDLTDPEGLIKAKKQLDDCRAGLLPETKIILVGTKSDASDRKIPEAALQQFAHTENVTSTLVSVKNNNNIDELRELVTRQVLANLPVANKSTAAGESTRAAASSSSSNQRKPGIFNYLKSKLTGKKEETPSAAASPSDTSKRRPRS